MFETIFKSTQYANEHNIINEMQCNAMKIMWDKKYFYMHVCTQRFYVCARKYVTHDYFREKCFFSFEFRICFAIIGVIMLLILWYIFTIAAAHLQSK